MLLNQKQTIVVKNAVCGVLKFRPVEYLIIVLCVWRLLEPRDNSGRVRICEQSVQPLPQLPDDGLPCFNDGMLVKRARGICV